MLSNHELINPSAGLDKCQNMSISYRLVAAIRNGKNCDNHDKSKKFDKSKWMNPRAKPGDQYNPTEVEHYANVFTHGLVIIPSIIGAIYMSSYSKTSDQFRTSIIYGISLILLFTVSTLFHLFSLCQHRTSASTWRNFFHYCDRATIYVFIAASYSPWLLLRSTNSAVGQYMIAIVWISAGFGIAYQLIFHEKYKLLEVVFYLAVSILPSIVVIDMVDTSGLNELAIGGGFFLTGILFFKSDGVIPFAHAIWHLFVCMGAFTHYYAIFTHLIQK